MEKITLKALQLAGFQNADMIAKIISYVPNPQVAVEMLLGVYTPSQIELATRFRKHKYDSHSELIEMTEIDDLGDCVKFKVYSQKTQNVWWLTKEDKAANKYVTEKPKSRDDYYDWGYGPATGYVVKEQTILSIKEFNDSYTKIISVDDAYKLMDEWDNYPTNVIEELESTDLPF